MNQPYQPVPQQNGKLPQVSQAQMMAQMQAMQQQMAQLKEQVRSKGWEEKVMKLQGVFIKQKFELFEAVTGCETENRYDVYKYRPDGRAYGNPLLICKERSGCCARCCMTSDCRSFTMNCMDMGTETEDVVMIMRRPCQITCACLCRPRMDVFLYDPKTRMEEKIGTVVDNFDCCNFSFQGETPQGEVRFHLEAPCCQCAFWCKCPCDKCEKVVFDIYKGPKNELLKAKLLKVGKGCCKNAIGDADNFMIPFEKWMTYHDRCLLVACTILIDYRMFEESPPDKKKLTK